MPGTPRYSTDMGSHGQKRLNPDRIWTESEYLALPETGRRVELLDGELVCEPSPSDGHQEAVGNIHGALHAWAHARVPVPSVRLGPLDVRFAPGRILQPDVCIFLDPLPRDAPMPLTRVPDLCIEVVSRHRTYDRVTKRMVYAEAGVREMWTVLPAWQLVERWTGARLDARAELRERIESALLPGFSMAVASLRD